MNTYTASNTEPSPFSSLDANVQLAALFDLHRVELIDGWIELKHQLPDPRYQGQPPAQLYATTERQLSAVIEILTTGPHALSEGFLAGICHVYGQADLTTTVEACLLLKEAALPLIRHSYPSGDAVWRAVSYLDDCLRWIVRQHTRHYEAAIHRREQTDTAPFLTTPAAQRAKGASVPQVEGAGTVLIDSRFHQHEFSLTVLEERDRLAREMHDNLSQALGVLKMRLALTSQLLADGQTAQVHAGLHEMKEIASEAYTDAREAIFNLRAPISAGPDFLSSLKRYLSRYQASYHVDTQLIGADGITAQLSVQTATQVIRIIQEALTNIRKHAATDRACVRIASEHKGLCIRIEDSGCGFDPAQPWPEGGYGLRVMQERAESVGGRLKIDTAPGRGTRIVLWIPLASGGAL